MQSSKHKDVTRAHPNNSKMKLKNFFRASHRIIGATHLYAAAFGSSTLFCNHTTLDLMATALVTFHT